MPARNSKKIMDVIISRGIDRIFGFNEHQPLREDDLSKSYVLVYLPTQQHQPLKKQLTFSLHKDVADGVNAGNHILSVVFTMKSPDCIGGAIGISNRGDGNVSHTSEMTNYTPKDNSLYCFNGSYAAHCAYGIRRGVRFAVVLFIVTP
jgi:hypothetical protein